MTTYNLWFPVSAEIFIKHLTGFIEFDIINPLKWVSLVNPRFRPYNFFMGLPQNKVVAHKDQYVSMIEDLHIGLVFVFYVLIFTIGVKIRGRFSRDHETIIKMQQLYLHIKAKLRYNWTITLFTYMFILFCISCAGQISLFVINSKYQSNFAKVFSLMLTFSLILAIPVFTILTNRIRPYLEAPEEKARISNFYEGIHIYKHKNNVWYYRSFMVRRLLFAFIPTMFPKMSFL